jgi:hypothetical protein
VCASVAAPHPAAPPTRQIPELPLSPAELVRAVVRLPSSRSRNHIFLLALALSVPLVWDQEVAGSNPVAPTNFRGGGPRRRVLLLAHLRPDLNPVPPPWRNVPIFVYLGALTAAAIYLGGFFWVFGGLAHWPGSASYVRLAQHLLLGQGYSLDGVHPTAQRPPLYPLILEATMRATGDRWFLATMLLQAVVAALCLVMAFALARALWPRSPAPWLSLGLLAWHGPFMFEMLSLRETGWFTLALLAVAWLLLQRTRPAANGALLGLMLASLFLLRPTGLLVWAVTLAFLGWNAVRSREGARPRFAAALVTSLVVIAPWQVFTWRNFGAGGFFPASSNGYNLAKGADAELIMISPWLDADSLDPQLRELTGNIPSHDERALDRAYRQIALGLIRERPRAIFYRSALSAAEFVSPLPIPLGTGTFRNAGNRIIIENFRPHWAELAFAPVVLVLLGSAVGGVRMLFRAGGGAGWFGRWVLVVFLSFLTIHALTFTKSRYRLPLDALLAVPAGGWLAGWKRQPAPRGENS